MDLAHIFLRNLTTWVSVVVGEEKMCVGVNKWFIYIVIWTLTPRYPISCLYVFGPHKPNE